MVPSSPKKTAKKSLTPVMEDYLEAIFDLGKEKKVVRVKDIAARLTVKMPTVTSMLKTLRGRGLVDYEKYEYVELTRSGTRIGREMRRRHEILNRFLTDILRIDGKTADEEACQMEHALSKKTLESLTDFMAFIQACPRAGENWLDNFAEFRRQGGAPDQCAERSEKFACELQQLSGNLCDGSPCGADSG